MRRRRVALGTVRRGRVKVYSRRQMAFLHAKRIDHTHFTRTRRGRMVRRRHTY